MDYDFKSQIITSLKKNNSTITKGKRLFQEHLTDIVLLHLNASIHDLLFLELNLVATKRTILRKP